MVFSFLFFFHFLYYDVKIFDVLGNAETNGKHKTMIPVKRIAPISIKFQSLKRSNCVDAIASEML